jgi:hypothetical protein
VSGDGAWRCRRRSEGVTGVSVCAVCIEDVAAGQATPPVAGVPCSSRRRASTPPTVARGPFSSRRRAPPPPATTLLLPVEGHLCSARGDGPLTRWAASGCCGGSGVATSGQCTCLSSVVIRWRPRSGRRGWSRAQSPGHGGSPAMSGREEVEWKDGMWAPLW